jgi:hypothetical protein
MLLFDLDGWGIATLGLLVAGSFIGYRLTWRLAYFSEGIIINLTRAGLQNWARRLLRFFVGYDEQTYGQSRFVVWNRVSVRFFILWSSLFVLIGIGLLFRLPVLVWGLIPIGLIVLRLIQLGVNPSPPPIQTTEAALKELIQQVNEPKRKLQKSVVHPQLRPWDYLDELFAS